MTTTAISAQGATLTLGATITAKNITAITKANPPQVTSAAHGITNGALVKFASVGGMTEINGKVACIGVKDVNTVYAYGIDSTGYGTYTSGGTMTGSAMKVGNWKSYSGMNGTRDELDATNFDSTAKEFLPGLADFGTLDIGFHVDDADDGQNALRANFAAPAISSLHTITFANGKTRSFQGWTKSVPENASVNALLEGTTSIRISGPVTRT